MCNVHLFKSHTDLKQNQQYQERQCTFSDMLLIYAVHVCCLSHCPLLKEKRGRSYGTFICRLCLPSWYVVRSATISSHTILPERGTVRPWDLRSIEKKIYALNRGSLLCWRLIVGNSIGASCMDKVLAYCSFWVLSSCPMLLEGSTNVQAYPEGWHKPEGTYFTFLCLFERRFSTLHIRHLNKAILDYKSAFMTVSEIKPTNFHHYSQLTMHSLIVLHSLKVLQSNCLTTAWGSFRNYQPFIFSWIYVCA